VTVAEVLPYVESELRRVLSSAAAMTATAQTSV
jgi:hypothetical protein